MKTPEEKKAYYAAWRAAHRKEQKDAAKRWRGEHPDRVRANAKQYREDNREERKAKHKIWRDANLEKVRAANNRSYVKNRERAKAYQKRRSAEHPEIDRAERFKRLYGLTLEQVDALGHNGMVCGVTFSEKSHEANSRHIDHDHVTKQVRGVLCLTCNTGIGKLKDSPDLLLAARNYLLRRS